MNKRYKEKWLTALRSGKYKQGRLTLYDKDSDSYCCLGVLYHCVTGKRPNRKSEILGKSLALKVGLDPIALNSTVSNCNQLNLADMNDNQDMTLEQIADVIEKNL